MQNLRMILQPLLIAKKTKGFDMQIEKIILVGLIANVLAACSSPPTLTEPKGDWVSFEPARIQTPAMQADINVDTRPVPISNVAPQASQYAVAEPNPGKIPLVKSDGKNVPLYKAVREIVPEQLALRLTPDVSKQFRGNVSWDGNDQWPYVLRKMLASHGLEAEINETKQEVVVKYSKQQIAPANQLLPPKTAVLTSASKDVKVLNPPMVPVVTQAKPLVPENSKPLVPAKPKPLVPEKPKPIIKPVSLIKVWKIDKGTSLKKGFDAWVSNEKCPTGNGKWNVRWDTDVDYSIDYPLSFTSQSFEDATSQLFNLYRKAQAPLYVSGYRNQCLIVINDKK